jgi:glycosyltransferase involved in cell wall biosynthesis
MKIDIIVHGRFWAFNFACALIRQGHDVRVLTNYPRMIAKSFGVDPKLCISNLWHGISSRIVHQGNRALQKTFLEERLHRGFGSWASRVVRTDSDVVYCFSGVAEEVLAHLKSAARPSLGVVVRGSAHIRTQRDLLVAEEKRWGGYVERPSDWMVAREEREYAAADRIVVLSQFAMQSFLDQGVAPDKLVISNLGVDTEQFAPPITLIEARHQRILAGAPLHVLTVGSLSARKGALDLFSVAETLRGAMHFRFVGDFERDASVRAGRLSPELELKPRVPEVKLPDVYAWADVFLFPTIEDGFAAVLAQAVAAGIPIICTENCGGPDLLRAGAAGWVVATGSPREIIERLRWCDKNRVDFAKMLPAVDAPRFARDWDYAANDFAKAVRFRTEQLIAPPTARKRSTVDIVVHGRFFAFSLAQALAANGQHVRVLTNYPKLIAAKFGVARNMIVPCIWHGISSRGLHRLGALAKRRVMEPWVHMAFGRWAAARVRHDADAVVCFSGVAEEVFRRLGSSGGPQKILVRGSAHIREQHRLLLEEELRVRIPVDKPSMWMVGREEREYELADRIVVLSTFALDSFKRHGVNHNKLSMIGLGTDTARFRPTEKTLADRQRRIVGNSRLRVLMVGSLTPQKGAFDYVSLANRFREVMDFRFVGDVPQDVSAMLDRTGSNLQIVDRVAENELPLEYAWGDIFVFPTIQDGYAVVIAQALASGLPVICTTNCAGSDVVTEGKNGWVVPIRDVAALAKKLEWCDANRILLAEMSAVNAANVTQRDWRDVAVDFEQLLFQSG